AGGQKLYELTDVPVRFMCPAEFALRPQFQGGKDSGKITVRVWGPSQPMPPDVKAFIDLTIPGRKFDAGLYAGETIRLQLPKDFELAQAPPQAGPFRLVSTRLRYLPANPLKPLE